MKRTTLYLFALLAFITIVMIQKNVSAFAQEFVEVKQHVIGGKIDNEKKVDGFVFIKLTDDKKGSVVYDEETKRIYTIYKTKKTSCLTMMIENGKPVLFEEDTF